jgi:hypothetical protein
MLQAALITGRFRRCVTLSPRWDLCEQMLALPLLCSIVTEVERSLVGQLSAAFKGASFT